MITPRNSAPVRATLIVFFLLLSGCDVTETVSPVPVPSTTATTTDGGAGGGGGEGGGAPTPKILRTVEQRSPFGNVAATDNLLWDGDFEWSSAFADQYGWLSGPPYSYDFPAATIGAACRSGLKCATVAKNKAIIGLGVGAQSAPLSVTVLARPEMGTCADVDVFLLDGATLAKDVSIPHVSDAPDSTGWCLYSSVVESHPSRVYLLVDNNTGATLLVDDAVVRVQPPGDAPPPPAPPKVEPPSAERAARRDAAREAITRLRGPHIPPPNAARRAFEERFSR